ncbi:hypothetical protein GCM10012275_01520 [Longimycelium tulufanense]|uniref:Methyltransferase n=1 Tax=Longimycelium tulufanense TaxID=907463 RepID=A0A8J3C5Q7_9PSEU|nr:class I SAM-dependent methyltransferase [Longimycelium tulufanense]GGM33821.1 hypothetical protein GCM10012275_01520 [Longimycelium tulufanense]
MERQVNWNARSNSSLANARFRITFPDSSVARPQDAERCLVEIDGRWREIRFHDYARIYAIKGLYEQLFYDRLRCSSPRVVATLLGEALPQAGATPADLRVLDLGAGNGIMGAELVRLGVDRVVGVDILPEAGEAAHRDRPGIYHHYLVGDVSMLGNDDRNVLEKNEPNALTCIAALGFDDIPPHAFRAAFNFVSGGGWIAFTLKEDFLSDRDSSGFSRLIRRCVETGVLEVRTQHRYQHRLSASGHPLYYVAIVGTKRRNIPPELVD